MLSPPPGRGTARRRRCSRAPPPRRRSGWRRRRRVRAPEPAGAARPCCAPAGAAGGRARANGGGGGGQAALVREVLFVMNIDGVHLKWDDERDAFVLPPTLPVARHDAELVGRLAELGWMCAARALSSARLPTRRSDAHPSSPTRAQVSAARLVRARSGGGCGGRPRARRSAGLRPN